MGLLLQQDGCWHKKMKKIWPVWVLDWLKKPKKRSVIYSQVPVRLMDLNQISPLGRRNHPGSGSSRCAPGPQWFSGRRGCQSVWCLCSLACSSSTAASQQTPADRRGLRGGGDRARVAHFQTRCSKAVAAKKIIIMIILQTYPEAKQLAGLMVRC